MKTKKKKKVKKKKRSKYIKVKLMHAFINI